MPNPLQGISEILAEAAREADVLPAAGQAVFEEAAPDAQEREETTLSAGEYVYDTLWEKSADGGLPPLYAPAPPCLREEDHLYRYFMDGSFRSYFLGTLVAPQWESPVTFGQVGACVLHRTSDGAVQREVLRVTPILAVAKRSDHLWQALEQRAANAGAILRDILTADQLTSPALPDLRDKATGKVRWEMHLLEAEVIGQTLPKLSSDCWLIADGSLRFDPLQRMLQEGDQVAPVLGVAKSFRREVRFRYGRGPRAQDLTLYRLLAALPFAHRTAAFGALNGKVVFWYVRLREQQQMEYPLMGVIKAELINPTGEALPAELIDRLSRALVAERSVTPHGRDRRWHAHLYPIYLAETAVKDAFHSAEVIRSALIWR